MGVFAWNYFFPDAEPLEDVIVAILLSLLSMTLKSIKNSSYSEEK